MIIVLHRKNPWCYSSLKRGRHNGQWECFVIHLGVLNSLYFIDFSSGSCHYLEVGGSVSVASPTDLCIVNGLKGKRSTPRRTSCVSGEDLILYKLDHKYLGQWNFVYSQGSFKWDHSLQSKLI